MIDLLLAHLHLAPYLIFILILLAGANLPISTDVLIVISAFISGSIAPEYTLPFYLVIMIGAYFSAWISYWFGRILGEKMLRYRFFQKMFPQDRLDKIERFYAKHGFLVLLFGRFIPFGTRNCIFMSSGLAKASFPRFILRDAIACPLWATTAFFTFHSLGTNYQLLIHYLKTFNLVIFAAFALVVSAVIWLKKRKQKIDHTD